MQTDVASGICEAANNARASERFRATVRTTTCSPCCWRALRLVCGSCSILRAKKCTSMMSRWAQCAGQAR